MPEQYDNTNQGVLFENEDTTKSDYSGSINIDGQDHWLNGWKKTSRKTGRPFISVKIGAPKRSRD